MSKIFWKALRLSPAFFSASLLLATSAQAQNATVAPNQNTQAPATLTQVRSVDQLSTQQPKSLAQVTSVSQLSDVQPTDWAFQALQSLVERYGVIAGYPDSTFRGNRALTRYEFAAGLNAALDRVNELIAAGSADLVRKEDLATLQRLQEEFAAEIATLRGRVDSLEARTAEIEANQFSTTTKLVGEVVVAVAGAFGDQRADGGDLEDNVILANRARLNFDTSFFGKDRLRTRLQARNITQFDGTGSDGTNVTGTNMTRLGFDGDNGNDVELDDFYYRFPIGDFILAQVDFDNVEANDNLYTFNPLFESSGSGAISRYGRFSPIYRTGSDGSGLTLTFNPEGVFSASAAYLARNANDPNDGFGLFNGDYSAIGQVAFRPSDRISVGFTYAHTYDNTVTSTTTDSNNINLFSSTGSSIANNPFDGNATSADNFGLQASVKLTNTLTVSGWGGYTKAHAQGGARDGDDAEAIYWAATLGLQDFGKEGNLLGVIFGQPPKLTSRDNGSEDPDTSYHLEGLYRYQLTDNISITPGVLVIFNPEHNSDNDTIYVGTLRTTFTF